MYNTFSWSPYLIAYIVFVIQTFIVASYVWFSKDYEPPQKGLWALGYRFWKHLFYGFYFTFGVIVMDTALMWCLGQWTYRDWSFQLPSVILGLVLGIQYLIATILKKPTKIDLGYAITVILTILLLNHLYIPRPGRMVTSSAMFIMVSVALIVILPFIKEIERFSSKNNEPPAVYDITNNLHKIFSRKFNIAFWIIATMEAMLKFAGSSLFIW